MARAVGFDVGAAALKTVVLDGHAKRWRVASATVDEVTAGDTEAIGRLMHDRMKEAKAPRDKVAAALPAHRCVFRNVHLPFTGEEQVAQTIKFEAESAIPYWNMDDCIVASTMVSAGEDHSEVFLVVAPKDQVSRTLDVCEKGGVDPAVVDVDGAALFNAAVATGAIPEEGVTLLLHVGARHSLLVFADGDKILSMRAVPAGLFASDPQAVEPDLEAEAEEGEESEETAPPAPVEAWLPYEDLVPTLSRELSRSLVGYTGEAAVERVLVSGGGLDTPGLIDALHEASGLEVVPLDLLGGVEHDLDPGEAESVGGLIGPAMGAALRMLEIDATGLDLRQEELRYTRRYDALKTPMAACLTAVAVWLTLESLVTGLAAFQAGRGVTESLRRLAVRAEQVVERSGLLIPDGGWRGMTHIERELGGQLELAREQLGEGEIRQPMSALEAQELVMGVFQEAVGTKAVETREEQKFVLDKISLDSRSSRSKDKGQYVEVTVNATIFHAKGVPHAQALYYDLLEALEGVDWCTFNRRSAKTDDLKTGPPGLVIEGLKLEVRVPGTTTPEAA